MPNLGRRPKLNNLPIVRPIQLLDPLYVELGEGFGGEAEGPVAAGGAGGVDAGGGVEGEEVLDGGDGEVGG